MEIKQLVELDKLNQERFQDTEKYYKFLMYQIQAHMIEIDDLKNDKDPHMIKEAADIALLCHMLAISLGADKNTFLERIEKIKGKIKENSK